MAGSVTLSCSTSPTDRFWHRVTEHPETNCWVWRGNLDTRPQHMRVDGRGVLPYRWAYEQMIGPIPQGMTLDHLCFNPGCVNPFHCEPVPLVVNIRRARTRAAEVRTECDSGLHPWPESAAGPEGKRYCRPCYNARMRRWKAARKTKHPGDTSPTT